MNPNEAMERLNTIMAHAWMVRNFLKHAEEVQEDEGMLEVHRMIFDYIRALEPSYQRRDAKEYLRRASGKLPKLRRVAEHLAQEYRQVSTHTNFEMAAASLSGCVRHIEEILAAVQAPNVQEPEAPEPE
jgi:hypothetical protein